MPSNTLHGSADGAGHQISIMKKNRFIELTHSVIEQALKKAERPAVLCSYGKDSIVLLDLIRQHIDLNLLHVVHVDTTFEFPELYSHKKLIIDQFGIDAGNLTVSNTKALSEGKNYGNTDVLTLTQLLKTQPLNQIVSGMDIDFLFTGIRRDEEGSRAKERYFSRRDDKGIYEPSDNRPEYYPMIGAAIKSPEPGTGHYRVNALLDWTELDIWQYTKEKGLPLCPLYFAKNGKRYRSLGCRPVTTPVDSDADTIDAIIEEVAHTIVPERASRAKQDQSTPHCMEILRRNGFC